MSVEPSSSTSSATAYEAHLTSLSLEALLAEPNSLQTQAHHLTSSLTSLTHTSYPTFLSVHQSTDALSASLTQLSGSLSSLVTTALPALQDAAAAWHTRTTAVLHERSKARLVLDQHDKLKDLLDVSLFIDSCVRNGHYQEALSISNHITSLASRPDAPALMGSIHTEVRLAVAQMLVALLGTLHEPGRKLPALWKAVNFLRKMDAFSEDEEGDALGGLGTVDGEKPVSSEDLLILAFLTGRLACMTATLDPIYRDIHRLIDVHPTANGTRMTEHAKEDVARHLKKYIDTWREGAYDIVTQFSTIFLEYQSHPQPISPTPSKTIPKPPQHSNLQSQPTSSRALASGRSLLPVLCPHLLSYLVTPLQESLSFLSLTLLPSLLTQLTYCATAFTRIGMDFRAIIGNIVSKAVATIVCRDLNDVGSIINEGKGAAASKRPSEWLILPNLVDSPPSSFLDTTEVPTPVHIPPQILASYPPLARHTNAFLGVFNALRLLAPVGIMQVLAAELDKVLGKGGSELIRYLKKFLGEQGTRKDERIARAVGDAYFKVLVPFLRRALVEGVYGMDIASLGDTDEDGCDPLRKAVAEWEGVGS